MAVTWTVDGIALVNTNIEKSLRGMVNRSRPAMRLAGLAMEAEAGKLTPVDTGNLRGSRYSRVVKSGGSIRAPNGRFLGAPYGVEVGYGANYAVKVHETNANYRVGQWKFLEMGVRAATPQVIQILGAEMQVRRA